MAKFDDLSRLLEQFVKDGPTGCGVRLPSTARLYLKDILDMRILRRKTRYRRHCFSPFFNDEGNYLHCCDDAFERGKFLLNEPIYEYFPEYRDTHVLVIQPNGNEVIRKAKNPMLIKHAFMMSVGLPYPFLIPGSQKNGES